LKYSFDLIRTSDELRTDSGMFSAILLKADRLSLMLRGSRCWLDGRYLLCLSGADAAEIRGGTYEARNIQFAPYFYNVNLTFDFIEGEEFKKYREKFGYPDFGLFRFRDADYVGVIPVSDTEYGMLAAEFANAENHIALCEADSLWSCRTRSDLISIFRIAESANLGMHGAEENEVIRYIRDNVGEELTLDSICRALHTNRTTLTETVKTLTGMPPMRYVLEERLNQSRPDLLFTQISIRDIAERCGFSDVNYYIRAFGKRYGKTPLQYRIDGVAERMREMEKYTRFMTAKAASGAEDND